MVQKNKIEELIIKYFNDELLLEEKTELLNILEQKPEHQKEFRKYKIASDLVHQSLKEIDFDYIKAYERFKDTLNKSKTKRTKKVVVLVSWLSTAAAVLFFVWLFNKPAQQIQLHTNISEVQEIELIDGSRISLNENSQISYPKKFKKTQNQRYIKFAGEGYFEITSNPEPMLQARILL